MVTTKMNWSSPKFDFLPKWITFGPDQFIFVVTISFWSWPNHYGQVQINLVGPKPFWTDQNCFGHIEGQGITVLCRSKLFGPDQDWIALSAAPKDFVPLNGNHLFLYKQFGTWTICQSILALAQKVWTSPKYVGTWRRARHLNLIAFQRTSHKWSQQIMLFLECNQNRMCLFWNVLGSSLI